MNKKYVYLFCLVYISFIFFRFDRWALDGSEATMVAGGESAGPPFFLITYGLLIAGKVISHL